MTALRYSTPPGNVLQVPAVHVDYAIKHLAGEGVDIVDGIQIVDVFQALSQHVARWTKHVLIWDPKGTRIRRLPFVDVTADAAFTLAAVTDLAAAWLNSPAAPQAETELPRARYAIGGTFEGENAGRLSDHIDAELTARLRTALSEADSDLYREILTREGFWVGEHEINDLILTPLLLIWQQLRGLEPTVATFKPATPATFGTISGVVRMMQQVTPTRFMYLIEPDDFADPILAFTNADRSFGYAPVGAKVSVGGNAVEHFDEMRQVRQVRIDDGLVVQSAALDASLGW